MKHTWQHPELGRFSYEWTGWVRNFRLPAFKSFKYRWHGRHVGTANIPIEFAEENEESPPPPSLGAIRVAQRMVKNQQTLADKTMRALWRDLRGTGRDSGMWWHGELDESTGYGHAIPEEIRSAIQQPQDLCKFLGGVSIRIHNSVYRFDKPCATIRFEAAFDIEHGAGVLTDGRTVLGTGYMDAGPYRDREPK